MIDGTKLQQLAGHLDFEFDPVTCTVVDPSSPYGFNHSFAISEVGDTRYAEFVVEPYKKPSYVSEPVDGIVTEDLNKSYGRHDWHDDDLPEEYYQDRHVDQSLHGLVEERDGYIALYHSYKALKGLYRFITVNGPQGANNMHQLFGRTPGADIPAFALGDNVREQNTAGQITEAIAEMKILVPGAADFSLMHHDLGAEIGHGLSWPHTPGVVYRHLSRVAQDTVETYGDQIHYTTDEEKASRPTVVISVAKALDGLIQRVRPSIYSAALVELKVRDGRYDTFTDNDISHDLLRTAFHQACSLQLHTATQMVATTPDIPESERNRRGYWISMQIIAGVLGTRLALHEVQPHPEATDQQTLRTLGILQSVKTEIDHRLSDNKDYTLAA